LAIKLEVMNQPARISYAVLLILAVLVVTLHLGTFLLTALFGYLILQLFCFRSRKALSVALFLITVAAIGVGVVYFSSLAYRTLPKIAEISIPAMVEFAEKNGIDLPFTDFASLKQTALDQAREGFAVIGQGARAASVQFVLVVAGLVVALSIFLRSGWTSDDSAPLAPGTLYSTVALQVANRFRLLYESFARVMRAQIAISTINTVLTTAFLIFRGYPSSGLLALFVFLCGLLPIVGNIISNTLIVVVGFAITPRTGLYALIFLVVIHKLEYFLNSKIVGKQINSPIWLTLIGLVLGEKLMGISGMILAPAILHYIRVETSTIPSSQSVEASMESPVERVTEPSLRP
jgi:predicted PurR-regulated permease PerM